MIAILFGIGMYVFSIWLLLFGNIVEAFAYISIATAVIGTVCCVLGWVDHNIRAKENRQAKAEEKNQANQESRIGAEEKNQKEQAEKPE